MIDNVPHALPNLPTHASKLSITLTPRILEDVTLTSKKLVHYGNRKGRLPWHGGDLNKRILVMNHCRRMRKQHSDSPTEITTRRTLTVPSQETLSSRFRIRHLELGSYSSHLWSGRLRLDRPCHQCLERISTTDRGSYP